MESTIAFLQQLFPNPWRPVSAFMLLIALIVVNWRWAKYDRKEFQWIGNERITRVAKRDLSMIGDSGYKLRNSLSTWLYSILVICFRQSEKEDVMPVIRKWAETGIDKTVEFDVEQPYTKFLNVIREAHENEIDSELKTSPEYSKEDESVPKFNVSPEYDYHALPKTLKFNDYVDCESLIAKIDETMRRSCNEQ